jgi:hypothetical protein
VTTGPDLPPSPLTRGDVILVVGWLVLAAFTALAGPTTERDGPLRLVIEIDNGRHSQVPLSVEDRPVHQITIEGPIGPTVLEVGAGRARILSAPCRQQICRLSGWLSEPGDLAVCVPNRLVLRVAGRKVGHTDSERIDGVTR